MLGGEGKVTAVTVLGGEVKVTAVTVLDEEGKVTAVTVLGGEGKVTAVVVLGGERKVTVVAGHRSCQVRNEIIHNDNTFPQSLTHSLTHSWRERQQIQTQEHENEPSSNRGAGTAICLIIQA